MRPLLLLAIGACSSSAPPPAQPVPAPPADAAVAVEIDAAPARPDIKATATPYVFRFASTARNETWTMWFASGVAVLDVQPDGGAITQYQGSATEGATLVIDVAGPTAKLVLDCKRTKRDVAPPCSGAPQKGKPKKVSVEALDCFVPNFKEPMPFGPAPGIEFVADGACAGYRVRAEPAP